MGSYSKAMGSVSTLTSSPRLRRTDSLRQRSSSVSSVLTQSTLISVEPHNSNLNCTQLGVLGINVGMHYGLNFLVKNCIFLNV